MHVSPVARKMAAELGIDLASLAGTGPGGRITLEDVQQAAQAKAAQPAPGPELDRRARMRQAISAAMARSKREIPHYYLSTAIDMSRVMAWLTQENLKRSVEERLVYGVLLLKAVALALHDVPELNSVWNAGKAVPLTDIHVGVAISLRGGGLVAPALHNTDRQSLDELMKNFRDLVQRARAGSLRSSELSDPTITVTSLGEQGVEAVFGIIYPPQVALVGFGKITERPWSSGGQIVSRPAVTATLSGDHRVSDGHRGGLFLAADRPPPARTGEAMTKDEIREVVLRALGQIAPEADLSQLKPNLRIRDQLDIDSMDLLNFVIGLHKEFKVEIPESDYPSLATLDGCVDYLASHRGA